MRMLFSNSVLSVAMFTKDSSNLMELSKKLRNEHHSSKMASLVLLLGELVIDVLILDGAGVVVGLHPAGAILKHPLHGDGLLGGPGHSRLCSGGASAQPAACCAYRSFFQNGIMGHASLHQNRIVIVGLVGANLRAEKPGLHIVRQQLFQGLTVLFVHSKKERRQHHRHHAEGWRQCCRRSPGEQKKAALQ